MNYIPVILTTVRLDGTVIEPVPLVAPSGLLLGTDVGGGIKVDGESDCDYFVL
jgi:hypothetical protein